MKKNNKRRIGPLDDCQDCIHRRCGDKCYGNFCAVDATPRSDPFICEKYKSPNYSQGFPKIVEHCGETMTLVDFGTTSCGDKFLEFRCKNSKCDSLRYITEDFFPSMTREFLQWIQPLMAKGVTDETDNNN